MGRGHGFVQFLAQAQAHQRITQVDGQLGQSQFRQASSGGHQLKARQLAGTGHIEKGDQNRLNGIKSLHRRLNAKGKGYRKVA